jgi:Protein of unknown function (DUF2795)
MSGSVDQRVRQVLHGLRFPAEKWQIVTQAEIYGADAKTRDQLYQLPMREYRSWTEVAATVTKDTEPASAEDRQAPERG